VFPAYDGDGTGTGVGVTVTLIDGVGVTGGVPNTHPAPASEAAVIITASIIRKLLFLFGISSHF
jgi:hypothetical protein